MQRLQKVIAHAGIASRRKAEEYITQGRVKVNGEVVKELGVQVAKKKIKLKLIKYLSTKKNLFTLCFINHGALFLRLQMIKIVRLSQIILQK